MNNIHPTETGGSGRVLPEKTAKPGDPKKHIIKCFQCGYSVIESRDLQAESTEDGNELVITTVTISNEQSKLPILLRNMATFLATSRNVTEPNVTSGCPLCGTYNPRGVGDDRDFFATRDLSDQ